MMCFLIFSPSSLYLFSLFIHSADVNTMYKQTVGTKIFFLPNMSHDGPQTSGIVPTSAV